MDSQQKQCSKCGVVKSLKDFYKDVSKKTKTLPSCKQCCLSRIRQYQKSNSVLVKTKDMVKSARKRAKIKNLPFDIDQEYVRSLVVSHCPVFGMPLEWSALCGNHRGGSANSPSLDRIDPTKGYVKGNVWIISNKANTFKSYATHEELKILAEAVGRAIVDSLDW
jgi:hypothetical protein